MLAVSDGRSPGRPDAREPVSRVKALLRALPDIARLIAKLARDPILPRAVKIALAAAAIYLASPVDFIPDFIPVLGYLDDALLAAVLVDGILSYVDRSIVLKYWPGSEASLDRVARAARLFARWVPGRLKRRVFAGR